MTTLETLNQEQIKEMNRINVLQAVRQHKTTTKQDLAYQLRLSVPTITANINTLLEEGFVVEAGVAASTGGRKPVLLEFNKNARYSIGVNITRENVIIVLMNLDREIIEKCLFHIDDKQDFEVTVSVIGQNILALLHDHQISKKKVLGIGLSLPGLVNEDKLLLEHAPNLGITAYDFHWLQKELGIKVYIENEANIAAYGEVCLGQHKNMNNVVYVSITEGVGTGIIIQNQIYKSSNKKAGEFGHMRISDEPILCKCGRTGCWELFASKKGLFKYVFEETGYVIDALETLFQKVYLENVGVQKALQRYMEYVFIGIENIVLGLNPEYIIIGGELGKYKEALLPYINEKNQLKSSYMEYEGTRIIFSDLSDQGAVIGAALLPQQSIFTFIARE